MFVILERPDDEPPTNEPPKLGTDLLYNTVDEAIAAARWELAQWVGRPPRLTVRSVGDAVWDSAAVTVDLRVPR